MKTLIVYSSLTGNTKKVAQAIKEVFGEEADLLPVESNPPAAGYDLIAVGFWVDRGTADQKARDYMARLNQQKVALFATLGAYPDSPHAKSSMENAAAFIKDSNQFVGSFLCQGKVDPKLIEKFKELPPDHPHAMNPERVARQLEAAKHPNGADLLRAQAVFTEIKQKLGEDLL